MKVLHVITGLRQVGAETILEKIVRASKAVTPAVEHAAVFLRNLGEVGPRLQAAGVSLTALGLDSPSTAMPTLWRLWHLLREQHSDVSRTAASSLIFALYVSLCAAALGVFRAIGSIIAFVLPVAILFEAMTLLRRVRWWLL